MKLYLRFFLNSLAFYTLFNFIIYCLCAFYSVNFNYGLWEKETRFFFCMLAFFTSIALFVMPYGMMVETKERERINKCLGLEEK